MDIKKYSGKTKRVTNNHTLSQSQQQIIVNAPQEEEHKVSVNLSYVKSTTEKRQHMLRTHKINLFSTLK